MDHNLANIIDRSQQYKLLGIPTLVHTCSLSATNDVFSVVEVIAVLCDILKTHNNTQNSYGE